MKSGLKIFIVLTGIGFFISCGNNNSKEIETNQVENSLPDSIENNSVKIILKSDVNWTFLNPKRGDKAPMAGTLWGDRNASEATGFLLKPSNGFSSPPHIHNVSYRGIVINGFIHNDDPSAETMWMPAGSYWTQPKGETHITSAKGTATLAYIEIEEGPYHVLPLEEAFDSGEKPVNVDTSNIVWVNASEINWIEEANNNTKMAFLWGSFEGNNLNGTLLKLRAGFEGKIYSKGSIFGAVVISGQLNYVTSEIKSMEPGSFLSSDGDAIHTISTASAETILYIRTNNSYKVFSN